MNRILLDHCLPWPCSKIAEDDETSWYETVWPEDFVVFMMPAIMWPVCGCKCMRYIKNVWASQHVWGLQGPQVLTLPISYMAHSMFCESVFGLYGLFVAHMSSKGYPEVLCVNSVSHSGNTFASQTSWEHHRAIYFDSASPEDRPHL
jgi:hypothetical protein